MQTTNGYTDGCISKEPKLNVGFMGSVKGPGHHYWEIVSNKFLTQSPTKKKQTQTMNINHHTHNKNPAQHPHAMPGFTIITCCVQAETH